MGIIIGLLFLISGVPQIIKLVRTKSSKDISVSMYVITWIAMVLTIVQAYQDGSTQVVISTTLSLLTVSISIFLTILYYGRSFTR